MFTPPLSFSFSLFFALSALTPDVSDLLQNIRVKTTRAKKRITLRWIVWGIFLRGGGIDYARCENVHTYVYDVLPRGDYRFCQSSR